MTDTIIFKGTIKSAYIKGVKNVEGNRVDEYRLNIDLNSPDKVYETITAYANSPKKYIPTWYKTREGNIILKSRYDIPVKDTNGNVVTFSEWLDEGMISKAEIKIKIKQKDGAIYPVAMTIEKDGEEIDYFEGM